MITKIAKVLTVFIMTVSVLFMGVALAIHSSGPNWQEDMQALPDYDFAHTSGESPSWSVKFRTPDATSLGNSPTLPFVIGKAYDDLATRNQAETAAAIQPIEGLRSRIADTNATVEVDKVALVTRIDQLSKTLADVNKKVSDLALAGDKLIKQANSTREEARDRREDKNRLLRQLQQIEADHFHLAAQEGRLLDTMFQLTGELRRLQIRNRQLFAQGATLSAPAPTAEPKAAAATIGEPSP
jgi:regulator of replication initiation timing